jgi:hypothetical protein
MVPNLQPWVQSPASFAQLAQLLYGRQVNANATEFTSITAQVMSDLVQHEVQAVVATLTSDVARTAHLVKTRAENPGDRLRGSSAPDQRRSNIATRLWRAITR